MIKILRAQVLRTWLIIGAKKFFLGL